MTKTPFLLQGACLLVAFWTVFSVQASGETAPRKADEQAALRWVREHAIRLKTVEPGNGFADMQPLDKVVGDARIVALGEATHGTHEFFELKHRIIEYLALRKGFTIFSIEANMPEAYRINRYVVDGVGDPRQLLKDLHFWTWDTQEFLQMILWMREMNKTAKAHLAFTGFDMQGPDASIQNVREFMLLRDQGYYRANVDALLEQVSEIQQQSTQQRFAVATAKLPSEVVAGKHVTITGYIRSQNISEGYAGLWMNVLGPQGSLAFKKQDQEITGTTPWTRYEISLDVPASATGLLFGATQSGTGTAWLDSMEITIDGTKYEDPAIDLNFESATAKGFRTGGSGYEVVLDKDVAEGGAQSLRFTQLPQPPPAALLIECEDLVKYLEDNRSRFERAGSSPTEVDWAIQSARLLLEFVQLKAGTQTRDQSMAENVDWIAKHNPGAKIILWAHNGHVANTGFSGNRSMDSYLRQEYGNGMITFGFAFNEGSFRALEPGKSVHEFTLPPAPSGTLDHALADAGIPLFAIDLRGIPVRGAVARWFGEALKSRSIGAEFSDSLEPSQWSPGPVKADFDVLLFVEKTSAAQSNP